MRIKMKKKNKSNFYIKHFDDYHSITSKTYNYQELGCFPTKDGYGYCRYFGLFFKGRRPSFDKIMQSLLKKVSLDTESEKETHYRTGEEIGLTLEDLEYEVKESLKEEAYEPYVYDN